MEGKEKKVRGKVNTQRLYTTVQAAKVLGLSPRRVRKLCSEGRLGKRFGLRSFIITAEELEEFKKQPREPGNPMFKKQSKRRRSSGS